MGRLRASETQGDLRKLGGVINCTTPDVDLDPATGSFGKELNGLVQYNAGPNAFGGTMMMLLDGGGSLALATGTLMVPPQSPPTPFSGTQQRVCLVPIGQPGATGLRNQATGAGYAQLASAFLDGAPCFQGVVLSGGGGVQTLGPQLAPGQFTQMIPTPMGGTFMLDLASLPPDRQLVHGFPFTTGSIVVQNVETLNGQAQTTTFVGAGSLNTSMGVGNLSLVAGSLGNRVTSPLQSSNFNYVRMVTFTPEPGATLMLGVALVGIAGAYVLMRRRAAA